MKFEIHFTLPDKSEDFVVIEGETTEELQQKAMEEVTKRKGTDPWSKKID